MWRTRRLADSVGAGLVRGVARARDASPGGRSPLRPGLPLGPRLPLSRPPAPPSHLVRSKVGAVFRSRGLRGSEEGGVKSHHRRLHSCRGGARESLLRPAEWWHRVFKPLLFRVPPVWPVGGGGGHLGAWPVHGKQECQEPTLLVLAPPGPLFPGMGRGRRFCALDPGGLSPEHLRGPRLGPPLGGFAESGLAARKPRNMGTGPSASLLRPVLHLSPRGTA